MSGGREGDLRAASDGTAAAQVAGEPTAEPGATVLVAPVLVRDYRRLLRLFPYTYRRAHEAEMLGHLLDGAQPGQSRPTRAERWDLLRAAAREWTLAPLGPTERQRAAAAVVVLVALTAVLAAPASQDLLRVGLALGDESAREVVGTAASPAWLVVATALVAVPLAPAWLLWVGSVVALATRLRRTGLALAALAAAAGVVAVGSLVAAERAFVAFQETGWVVALVASLGAVAARVRQTGPVLGARAGVATLWLTAVSLAVSVQRSATAVTEEGVWATPPGYPFTLAADIAILVGVAVLLVAVRPVRQAAPVLAGVLTALVLSGSDVFWSGALDTTAVNLGNVLGVVALSAVVTLVARWVVNRLDELAASRAAHRALLAGSGSGTAVTA
ncbi:hypothetical protein M768_01445 [Cellulosimicrobium cellulans F16]|uniref:Uncharacterized protein n=1 Tax=Cellulosimicrobium cellulans F16 TaxID=1350482 RepID=A0A0M0FBR8_CELCE|nr:hypothetical protein [Cellulosimicrobium cellulans]KON74621.1 hypothetical protein M768_01445 [Cellulosimicrobium cellulans F16]